MRTLSVFVLFGIALMLTVVSNIGLWIDRTVYDTDTFVATTDDVLDDPDVQQVLADRFSAELYTAADVDQRLQTELPEGLKFLALPLGTAAREFLRDASLRIVERQPFEDTRNRSLAEVHSRLIDAIEGESDAVSTEDDALVLDLQPVIERVAEDVTGRDVNVPREGGAEAEIPQDVLDRLPPDARARLEAGTDDRLLGRVELPDDAGRFVIEDRSVAWAYRIARYGNDVVYAAIGVTLASYVLAVAFARDRRGAVRTSGIVLSAAGLISLALLLPVGYAARSFAENKEAASSVVDVLTAGYRTQSLILIGAGLGIAVVAALFGSSDAAVSVRSMLRSNPDAPSFQQFVRARIRLLRVVGLVGAALVLIVWPEPTTRVYVTTFALAALYMLTLYVAASEAPWAARARERLGSIGPSRAGEDGSREGAIRGWIAGHAPLLRIAGVSAVAVLIVAWPDLNLRFVVMVVALGLIYLAAIDLAKASGEGPPRRPAGGSE